RARSGRVDHGGSARERAQGAKLQDRSEANRAYAGPATDGSTPGRASGKSARQARFPGANRAKGDAVASHPRGFRVCRSSEDGEGDSAGRRTQPDRDRAGGAKDSAGKSMVSGLPALHRAASRSGRSLGWRVAWADAWNRTGARTRVRTRTG